MATCQVNMDQNDDVFLLFFETVITVLTELLSFFTLSEYDM